MGLPIRLRHVPGRVAAGAFILNSGLGKWGADEETAGHLHGMATGAYPFLAKVKPQDFARLLSAAEISVGTMLLLPVVPDWLAGAALTGFSGGLLGLYWKTPGMHQEGSPLPTQQGVSFAKDVWMLGIGLGMVADEITDRGSAKD